MLQDVSSLDYVLFAIPLALFSLGFVGLSRSVKVLQDCVK